MSESEEMYVVTIAMLQEAGASTPIPLSRLASELDIQPVSANQMIKKLEEEGLVSYTPYKGVELTSEGEKTALRILRYRRLWEVFLVHNLSIPILEASELACRMEHILPKEAAERLAKFLDEPLASPQGLPIPQIVSGETPSFDRPLSELQTGQRSRVTRIEGLNATQAFLARQGVLPGANVDILGVGSDGTRLLAIDSNQLTLSEQITRVIRVRLNVE
jgi:DtxR family Mn-dependent transcriptional regulator